MALESGTRRVRMVGAEHWTDTPERELSTVVAGGDTYAVHERICIDSARVRLVLAEGEDVSAALREVYGEAVRDVRVYRLVEAGTDVVEGLPEWRLTLPLVDDPAHDPLPGLIQRLAGAVVVAPAPEVVEPDEAPAAVVADLDVEPEPDVPALEPLAEPEAVVEPEPDAEALAEVYEPAALEDLPPVVLPDSPVMPEGTVQPEPVAEIVIDDVEDVEALEADVVREVDDASPFGEIGGLAVAAAAGAAGAEQHHDPFAVPAETVFPVEAAETVEAPAVIELLAEEPVADVEAEYAAPADVEQELAEATAEVTGTVDGPPLPEAVEAVEVADAVETVVEPEPAIVAEEPLTEPEVVEEPVAEVVPEPEPEPDPRDLHFAAVAAVLDQGQPTCISVDRDGPCSTASEVVWHTAAGAAWACAWHWPSAMAGYPGAEVGAVHGVDSSSWTTWRDGDSLTLARQAADLFADSAREHGSPVARPLVALDRLDEMLSSLPDDLRGAVLLWSISVTNPEWPVAAVVDHGRVTHALTVAEGRAVAFTDELYFQVEMVSAPIGPDAVEAAAPAPEVGPSGEVLFARGTAFAAAGDRRAAQQAWAEAADEHNHALSMRALGDLAGDRDDPKTAEEWYGRAAMLNDTPSMNRIATILEGRGQHDRAAEWLRRAARFGDEEAARRLQSEQGVVAASV